VPVYLVRHGKAGTRAAWAGDDETRPLVKAGWSQARELARWLGKRPVPRIISSPYVRCVETVQPLAERLDLKVEQSDALAEGVGFQPTLELLDEVADHTVLCSHGDIILDTMEALFRRGLVPKGSIDWRKGATWVLEREDGVWVRGKVVLPSR
jgi:8-oxo-dGTP diphosphatase